MTSYYKQAAMSGIIVQFAFAYTDDNRRTLSAFKDMPELVKYLGKQNIVDKFANYADKDGLQRRNLMIQKSHKLLEKYIVSRVVYNILNEQDWLMYLNEDDKVVEKALQVLNNGTSFPKKSAHQK
jgi:carboxyl-terminal processing protease